MHVFTKVKTKTAEQTNITLGIKSDRYVHHNKILHGTNKLLMS